MRLKAVAEDNTKQKRRGHPVRWTLFDNPEKKPLADLLSEVSPNLIPTWTEVVAPLEHLALRERLRLHALKDARQQATGVLHGTKPPTAQNLWKWLTSLVPQVTRYKKSVRGGNQAELIFKSGGLKLLSAGLSFMQFMSISELLGVDLKAVEPDEVLLLVIAVVAALSLTFGAKETVRRWGAAKKEGDRRPFWSVLASGDTFAWCCLVLVVGEAGFATPGLLSFFAPSLSRQLSFQLIAFLAAGLAAFVNVSLAFSLALQERELNKRFVSIAVEKVDSGIESLNLEPWVVQQVIKRYDREVRDQERVSKRADRMANRARRRWMGEVKRCMRSKEVRSYLQMKKQEKMRE